MYYKNNETFLCNDFCSFAIEATKKSFNNFDNAIKYYLELETKSYPLFDLKFTTIFRENGFSGYSINDDKGNSLEVNFAPLLNGKYLLVKKFTPSPPSVLSSSVPDNSINLDNNNANNTPNCLTYYDFYAQDGSFINRDNKNNCSILFVDLINMEPCSSIMSHFYNLLSYEYLQAKSGLSDTSRIKTLEKLLHQIIKDGPYKNNFIKSSKDLCFIKLKEKLIEKEIDSSLTYFEKEIAKKILYENRRKIIKTKHRAHKLPSTYLLEQLLIKISIFFHLFSLSPYRNFRGISYQYSIGLLIRFIQVVKNNIGYSVALAIYGPFTFYFITQPMNPHAMWAVGKVRQCYLNTVEKVKSAAIELNLLDGTEELLPKNMRSNINPKAMASDINNGTTTIAPNTNTPPSNIIPKNNIFPVSSDLKEIPNWDERMSQFKNFQIGYEEHLQFSARMGRLEQMETQLNFSLIAESAYVELEKYLKLVEDFSNQKENSTIIQNRPYLKKYLDNEKNRTLQLELYIWDKLIRYAYDHKYIVMDSSHEQKYVDFYIGRSFVFLKKMTLELEKKFNKFQKPEGYEKLEKLSNFYKSKYVSGDTIEKRLNKNSLLFSLKEPLDGQALRDVITRQWEILFLLQNKAQEASNFGLQTYTWSVRNAIWILEALYSNKLQELKIILDNLIAFDKDNKINLNKTNNSKDTYSYANFKKQQKYIIDDIEPLYESLIHLLMLEYVSIRPEIEKRLTNDLESTQRQLVIQNCLNFLKERTSLLNSINNIDTHKQ